MNMLEFIEATTPYYDHLAKELRGSQMQKAAKFVKLGLVVPLEGGKWAVKPIPGYNIRTYAIEDNGIMTCNCQWNVKKHAICSHILAVLLYKSEERMPPGQSTSNRPDVLGGIPSNEREEQEQAEARYDDDRWRREP